MNYLKQLKQKFKKTPPQPRSQLPPSKKVCQISNQNKKAVYIVYKTVTTLSPAVKPHRFYKRDYAGIFTSREHANKIAACLNNIFLNVKDPTYYLATKYKITDVDSGYEVTGFYYNKKELVQPVEDVIITVTSSLKGARNELEASRLEYERDRVFKNTLHPDGSIRTTRAILHNNGAGMYDFKIDFHMIKYYLNDVMPTMNLNDYDLDKHQQRMKIITDELVKYPQRKKMVNVLENIDLLKHAPPSKVLPKGGLEYREMVNDPEFRKRWAKYDDKFKD